jgi:hypothetical protein
MSQPAVGPSIRRAAAADRDDLIDDSRPRVQVSEGLVDNAAADVAVVFFFEDSLPQLASAVPVGVPRVAHRLIR